MQPRVHGCISLAMSLIVTWQYDPNGGLMSRFRLIFCPMELNMFSSKAWTDKISPFDCLFGRKIDLNCDISPPFGSYCQVTIRLKTSEMQPCTLHCIY